MACIYPSPSKSPETLYPHVLKALEELIIPESNWIANAANAASALGFLLHDLNWAGFYLFNGEELVLGPFWGKPAVTRIAMGKGVCGTSAKERECIVVPDVHQYPGHIACDLYSNSEIVIPLIHKDQLIGVLDIDSPEIDRFDEVDVQNLKMIAQWLVNNVDFPTK